MMLPLDPLEAYRDDAQGAAGRSAGERDEQWLYLAKGFRRLEQLPARLRAAAVRDLARTLEPADLRSLLEQTGRALSERTPTAMEAATDSVQQLAAEMEGSGAYRLAFAMLASARVLFARRSPRAEGMLLAQQGRIARQIGDVASAEQLYRAAEALGEAHREPEIMVRALLGRGSAAAMRGNFPEARALFERALQVASAAELHTHASGAHHGLFRWALSAGDLDEAIHHGWAAFRQAAGDPSRRAELLTNLGEVCLLANRAAAALRAYRVALRLTPLARVRLAAIGGAVLAAARLGERGVLEELAVEAEHEVAGSGQPYENAVTLVELAEAYSLVGGRQKRERYRARALRVAEQFGYFEVVHRAEVMPRDAGEREPVAAVPVAPAPLNDASLEVLRHLETLELPAVAAVGGA